MITINYNYIISCFSISFRLFQNLDFSISFAYNIDLKLSVDDTFDVYNIDVVKINYY